VLLLTQITPLADLSRVSLDLFSIHFIITLHSSIAATSASQYKKKNLNELNKMLSILVMSCNFMPFNCKFWSTFVWLSGMFPAFRCNYSWFTTGRSSPSHVAAFPGFPSATKRIPFGRPVSSSRTLTTGLWTKGPGQTALCWEDAGR